MTIGVAAVLLCALLLIDPLRDAAGDAISGDTEPLREDLRGLGAGGVAIIGALCALHTFVWYPAEILDAAAGYVYGFWPALGIMMVFWTLQGIFAYEIGLRAARPVLNRFIAAERFDRLEAAAEDGGATLLLAARLVPIVPFTLFSFVAGAAEVPRRRFIWTTAIGYTPITALAIYFGTRLEDLSLTDPLIWITVGAGLALLLLARRLKPLFEGENS